MATVDDGVIRARVVVDEHGCAPFWLPSGYETRARVTCHDVSMTRVLSDRTINLQGRNYPRHCLRHSDHHRGASSAALFAHGFYNSSSTKSGIWHSACSTPEVACAPGGGASVRVMGDSVMTQQAEHWVESFWDGSLVTVSMTSGSNARDRGTTALGRLTGGYDQVRAATSVGLNGLSVLIATHSEGRFAFTGGIDPKRPLHEAVQLLVAPWRSTATPQLQTRRVFGPFGLYPVNESGFNTTVFGIGYHQTFSYAEMKAFITPLFQSLVDDAPGHRWVYLLNFSPNTTNIPEKFADQRQTRTVLQTWWANRAVLEAAQAHPLIEVADLFSPGLVLNEFVHGRKCDAVHLLGGDPNCTGEESNYLKAEAEAMRLTLLSRMCRGDVARIRYRNKTLHMDTVKI